MIDSDKIGRLRSMADPHQKTWDLSKNDVDAIRHAIDVICMLKTFGDSLEACLFGFAEMENDPPALEAIEQWRTNCSVSD